MVDKFIIYDQNVVENTTYINLFTTPDCQLNCSYCVEKTRRRESEKEFKVSDIYRVMDFIDAQEKKYVVFHFYGGEPTCHPYLLKFIGMVKERYGENVRIKLSTNLEKDLSYFKEIPKYVEVWASFHFLLWKSRKFNNWLEKAIYLNERKMLKKALLMCYSENINIVHEIYGIAKEHIDVKLYPIDTFRRTRAYKEFKQAWEFDEHDPFEDYQMVDIVKDGKKFNGKPTVEEFNNFNECVCNAGFDIFANGNVFYCSSYKEPVINLIVDGPKKVERIHLCSFNDCPCDPEFARVSLRDAIKTILGEKE